MNRIQPNNINLYIFLFILACIYTELELGTHCGPHDFNRTSCEALGCCFYEKTIGNYSKFCLTPPSMFMNYFRFSRVSCSKEPIRRKRTRQLWDLNYTDVSRFKRLEPEQIPASFWACTMSDDIFLLKVVWKSLFCQLIYQFGLILLCVIRM